METYPCSSRILNQGTVNQEAIGLPIDLKDPFLSAALLLTVCSHKSEAGWIVGCVSCEEVVVTLCPPCSFIGAFLPTFLDGGMTQGSDQHYYEPKWSQVYRTI